MDNLLPIKILSSIQQGEGVLWEHNEVFKNQLLEVEGVTKHQAGTEQSAEMADVYPLKQTLKGGLYTRELFMPKGHIIVSMIHKQDHPSFLLKGKVSYLTDEGTVETITAPHLIHTNTGTQRVLFIHEDTDWCCVYKTDKKTFTEAEADVYTDDYKKLPQEIINKRIECQEYL